MCRYRTKYRASAPIFRNQFVLGQLLLYALNIGTRLINLIDGNDNLNSRRLCMVDCFDRLRHDTVVCSDYQNRNIGGICSTHTHCRECLMSRCIQECDVLTVDRNNRCTDMLCDTACLFVCHTGGADRIQQGCLTMIDMTHDADNRRTCHKCLFRIVFFF